LQALDEERDMLPLNPKAKEGLSREKGRQQMPNLPWARWVVCVWVGAMGPVGLKW